MNIHIYPSLLTNESRIEKEVISLIDLKLADEVIVVGLNNGKLPKKVDFYPGVKFVRLQTITPISGLRAFRYILFLEYALRAFCFILNSNADIINCHSLHVLPIGVLIKHFKKSYLIYDAHELETEVVGSRGIIRAASKALEKICMSHVDYTIVVNVSIQEWYKRTYKISNITTIRNIPRGNNVKISSANYIREKFGLRENIIVFIYQGLLSNSRGVDTILEAFTSLPKDRFHVVFLGFGPMEEELEKISQKEENIHYIPGVASSEINTYTASADVGIHMIKNDCLNHFYCLPNKIFEYLKNGLPILASNLPEIKKIVEDNHIGWLIEPSAENLISIINNISMTEIVKRKQNVASARKKYDWRNEETNYFLAYKK